MAKVDGGVVDRQPVGRGPQIQGVAGAVALEAMKRVRKGIDAEGAGGAAGGTVQRTGAALLAGMVGAWGEAEQRQHLGNGNGGPHGSEVDGRSRRIGGSLELFVAGLPHVVAAFAGLGELAVTFGVDGAVVAEEFVVGGHITNGTVQTRKIVMSDVIGDDAACVVERQRDLDADALPFDGFVKTFELAVGLRIVGGGPHMGHAGNADELFEVFGDELRPVVGDDAWTFAGEFFTGALEDGFDVGFQHFFADFLVNDETAVAVKQTA